jgi:hypothetical protein
MNRSDIQHLQQMRGYPALTITLPTHRTSPDNRQDPIRVKNLVTQAANRLRGEFSKREIDPLLARLESLADSLDYRSTLDGLALFVNHGYARAFVLPFKLQERVIVDDAFAVRDLVFALNRTARYWVLSLSEKPTRLYEGTRDSLLEVTNGAFPMTHTGPGGDAPLPGGFGVRRSAHRDERHMQFFRQVDQALRACTADDPLPVAVVGVDRYQAFFNEVTGQRDSIVATLVGNYDKATPHELSRLVWPLVRAGLAQRRQRALEDLEKAVGEKKFASGMGEVWHTAAEGRGRLLLVEEGFSYPARLDPSGLYLDPADDPAAPGVLDDAVNDLITLVLDKQGQVVFVEDGQLAHHGRVAMTLRY